MDKGMACMCMLQMQKHMQNSKLCLFCSMWNEMFGLWHVVSPKMKLSILLQTHAIWISVSRDLLQTITNRGLPEMLLWHTNSSVDVSSRMFCKWRKHTPNWISNETRSRPSFGCNSSSSLFSAVLAPHFKFWCFKEKFSTGENIHQTWVVAVLRYLSTFGYFTEHSDKSQTFLWKTRDLLQPMKISTKHHTSTTRSQFETACRGLPFELVLVSWTRTPKVWKPLRNLERRQGHMLCCLYHAMVSFSCSIPSFPASHQQVNG